MEGVERTTAKVVVHSWRCRLRRVLHVSVVDEGRCDSDDRRRSGRSGSRLDCMVEIDGARAEGGEWGMTRNHEVRRWQNGGKRWQTNGAWFHCPYAVGRVGSMCQFGFAGDDSPRPFGTEPARLP